LYLNNKYDIFGTRTISRCKWEYYEDILVIDNQGKRKLQQEIMDIAIKPLCSKDKNPLSVSQIVKYQIIDKLKSEYTIIRYVNCWMLM